MFDLNEEDLKRAADEISKTARKIQEQMIKDTAFGERPPYSAFVDTARLASSIAPRPFMSFKPIVPMWNVTTSPYVVEKKKLSREMKMTFCQKVWRSLTELNPWPYSQIEIYEVGIPAIMIDRPNYRIICHPSLEREIKKAVNEGKI